MTPDELRALADALPEGVHWSDPITPDMLAEAIRRFCSDAQPVAVPAGWKLVPVDPTPEMLSAVGMMDGYDWHAPGCSPDADHANWYSAMIAAAPAVPQAEPKPTPASDDDLNVYKEMADNYRNDVQAEPIADSDADYWLRNRRPILDAIERAGFMLMSNASGFWLHPRGKIDAQAEQKRELARALAAEANKCCHRSDGWEEHLAGRFQHILTLHRPKE